MGIMLLLALILGQQAAPSPNGVREVDEGITRDITGDLIRETPHFRIFREAGFLPIDLDWFQLEKAWLEELDKR